MWSACLPKGLRLVPMRQALIRPRQRDESRERVTASGTSREDDTRPTTSLQQRMMVTPADVHNCAWASEQEGEPSHIPESLIETRHIYFCRKAEARGEKVTGRWYFQRGRDVKANFKPCLCSGNKPAEKGHCPVNLTTFRFELMFCRHQRGRLLILGSRLRQITTKLSIRKR